MGQKWETLDGKAPGVAKELPSNGWGEGENLNVGGRASLLGTSHVVPFYCTIWPSKKGSNPVIWDNSASESRAYVLFTLEVTSNAKPVKLEPFGFQNVIQAF